MATAAKITVDLETKTAGWTAGLANAGKEVRGWVKDVQKEFNGLTFSKGFSVAGVAGFAGAIKGVAGSAADLATALRTGEGYGVALFKALEGIPIIGPLASAAKSIKEIITGEEAARIEADRWAQSTIKVRATLLQIAADRETFGKFGEAKAFADVDASAQAKRSEIDRRRYDLQHELAEAMRKDGGLLAGVADSTPGFYTPAQQAQFKRLKAELRTLDEEGVATTAKSEDQKMRIRRDAAHNANEFVRQTILGTEELEAKMQEKVLRRQGLGVESAMISVRESAKHRISDLLESVSDFNLAGKDPADVIRMRIVAMGSIGSIVKEANEQVTALKETQAHKEEIQVSGHVEKMRQIEASAGIERLKLADEQANSVAEKNGQAARSHLAERAQIEEEFRKQAQEAVLKFREENPSRGDQWRNDPVVKGQLEALRAERTGKLGVLDAKSDIEANKNLEASLRDQRKLWEEVGTPMQKYAAHLADITEQYQKFGDAGLRNAQLAKLDKDTFNELKKLHPDHESPIELYGRTGSYADTKVGGAGEAAAEKQLETLKAMRETQEQAMRWFRDIWQAFAPGTAPQTIPI